MLRNILRKYRTYFLERQATSTHRRVRLLASRSATAEGDSFGLYTSGIFVSPISFLAVESRRCIIDLCGTKFFTCLFFFFFSLCHSYNTHSLIHCLHLCFSSARVLSRIQILLHTHAHTLARARTRARHTHTSRSYFLTVSLLVPSDFPSSRNFCDSTFLSSSQYVAFTQPKGSSL